MSTYPKKESGLFERLADFYFSDQKQFTAVLILNKRFTQQSFLNWCEFKGYESIAKFTKENSNFKLI